MQFVIIGGDAAGMSAASRAKRIRPDMEVTVLEQSADVSYSACGMPYTIADPQRSIDELVVRTAEVFRSKQGIDVRLGHRVTEIRADRHTVSGTESAGEGFQIAYDRLLIATGASPLRPDLPGLEAEGVMTLKSLAEGRHIKAFLAGRSVKRVVVIGMGYIALEMCEALRQLGIEVAMVKPRPVFLPWLDPEMAAAVRSEIEAHGVQVFPGHRLQGIEAAAGALKVVGADLELTGEMVLVAVGVTPNSALAAEAGLGLSVADAIAVDGRLQTSDPAVYSAGDCADAYHVVTGKKVWVPLALRANRAGWAVADNVCGRHTVLQGVAGTAVFKVFGLEVARTGLTPDEAAAAGFDPATVTIKTRSRGHAHPGNSTILVRMTGDRESGRLLGAEMVGREGAAHRINAAAVALHNHMDVVQFAQTDLAYAPPFGPTWDPLLTTANQLLKKL